MVIFELIDLQGPMKFFQVYFFQVYLKGSNFALGVKASRVLAMSIFLFSLFDCFSFSIFEMILSVFSLALFN